MTRILFADPVVPQQRKGISRTESPAKRINSKTKYVFVIYFLLMSCATYDPMISTNEAHSIIVEYDNAIGNLYADIIASGSEQDIVNAYDRYFIKLDVFFNSIMRFMNSNHSLVSSKCWRKQTMEFFIQTGKLNEAAKKKALGITAKYKSGPVQTKVEQCEQITAGYTYKLSKEYTIIRIANYSDMKDPYTIVFEDNGFIDIIFENSCTRYVGQTRNCKFHGKGRLYSDEGVTEGTWVDGVRNGFFIHTAKDGTIVKGNMVNGKLDGDVVFINPGEEPRTHRYNNGVCPDLED